MKTEIDWAVRRLVEYVEEKTWVFDLIGDKVDVPVFGFCSVAVLLLETEDVVAQNSQCVIALKQSCNDGPSCQLPSPYPIRLHHLCQYKVQIHSSDILSLSHLNLEPV